MEAYVSGYARNIQAIEMFHAFEEWKLSPVVYNLYRF